MISEQVESREVVRDLLLRNDPSNALVKAYAKQPPFRSATADELVNDENPFRRPVRPHDLGMLDYGTKLELGDAFSLSALLGHRMLRNIYDESMVFLPTATDNASWHDFHNFYSPDTRMKGHMSAPVLERHLFQAVEEETPALPDYSFRTVRDWVTSAYDERRNTVGKVFDTARVLQDTKSAVIFMLLQLTAIDPSIASARASNALGDYDNIHPSLRTLLLDEYRDVVDRAPLFRKLLEECELSPQPYAYWQFYLASSLAVANYFHFVSADHTRFFHFLGAWVYRQIEESLVVERYSSLVRDATGADTRYFDDANTISQEGVGALMDRVMEPLCTRYGEVVSKHFHEGFESARRLQAIADRDLSTQIAWADRLDEYKNKAEALQHKIDSENIEVELDTFVESSEETSTTHVHDEHRLVVIERGDMHFWNNVGDMIPLSEGDKMLIPEGRLHGSVVLSGECTYHQPIISEAMLKEV